MPVARPETCDKRVIAHLDLDCFYVQVEQRRQPELVGKPTAVVQYNNWKGGGLIAVGYEARRCGVNRNMRGDDAKKLCPDINLVQVPVAHEKADLSIYRDAGSEVVEVLSRVGRCERTSIDEVYLDLTEAAHSRLKKDELECRSFFVTEEALKSHIVGLQEKEEPGNAVSEWFCRSDASLNDKLLGYGAVIVAELRMAVLAETRFTCSAGIAHNKMLAKLTSGLHKPAQQTIVPLSAVPDFVASLPVKKIGQLGGKLGQSLEAELGVKTAGDLLHYSESKLQDLYGVNTGTWLWRIVRGIDGDEVQGRTLPKSHASGKTFPGPRALMQIEEVEHWLGELAEVLQERIESDLKENSRTARTLTLHASCHLLGKSAGPKRFPSKSCTLRYGVPKLVSDALRLFERALKEYLPASNILSPEKGRSVRSMGWAVTGMSITASNIITVPSGVNSITHFLDAVRHSPPRLVGASFLEKGTGHKDGHLPVASQNRNQTTSAYFGEDKVSCLEGEEDRHISTYRPAEGVEMVVAHEATAHEADINETVESCSHHAIEIDQELVEDEAEVAVECTPKFGPIGSFVSSRSYTQLPLDGAGEGGKILYSIAGGSGSVANAHAEREQSQVCVIACSPVELQEQRDTSEPVPLTDHGAEQSGGGLDRLFTGHDGTPASSKEAEGGWMCSAFPERAHFPQNNAARLDDTGESSVTAPPSSSRRSLPGRLEALWQRKGSPNSQSSQKLRTEGGSWPIYKQEEISQEVLSELPLEIQHELMDALALSRRHNSTKRGAITDFFKRTPPP